MPQLGGMYRGRLRRKGDRARRIMASGCPHAWDTRPLQVRGWDDMRQQTHVRVSHAWLAPRDFRTGGGVFVDHVIRPNRTDRSRWHPPRTHASGRTWSASARACPRGYRAMITVLTKAHRRRSYRISARTGPLACDTCTQTSTRSTGIRDHPAIGTSALRCDGRHQFAARGLRHSGMPRLVAIIDADKEGCCRIKRR